MDFLFGKSNTMSRSNTISESYDRKNTVQYTSQMMWRISSTDHDMYSDQSLWCIELESLLHFKK